MIETQFDLEVNAVRHCTFSCCGCNHSSAHVEKWFYDPVQLATDLDVLRKYLRVKLFFIQGGEPLLHPNVCELLKIAADSGMGLTGILTNGTLLHKQRDEFWETLAGTKSQLRVSVYPDLDPGVVDYAYSKCKLYGIKFIPRVVTHFSQPFKANDGSSYHGCIWNRCLTVHNGWFYLCPQSAFYPKQHMGLGEHVDGIELRSLTEEKLAEFLKRKEPLESCKMCAGHRGEQTPWHQVKNSEKWHKESGLTLKA